MFKIGTLVRGNIRAIARLQNQTGTIIMFCGHCGDPVVDWAIVTKYATGARIEHEYRETNNDWLDIVI